MNKFKNGDRVCVCAPSYAYNAHFNKEKFVPYYATVENYMNPEKGGWLVVSVGGSRNIRFVREENITPMTPTDLLAEALV